MLVGCRRVIPARASELYLAMGGDGVPRVEFVPTLAYPVPELPRGVVDWLNVDEVAWQLTTHVEHLLARAMTENIFQARLTDKIMERCAQLLDAIHPSFFDYIRARMPTYNKNSYAFIEYLNRFLLREKRYLYVRFTGDLAEDRTNLYSVARSLDVYIDGVYMATMHFLHGSFFDDPSRRGNIGGTHTGNPREITIWPEAAGDVADRVAAHRTWRSSYDLKESILRGAMYHEALHVQVGRRFSSLGKMRPADLSNYYVDVGGLLVYVDGSYSFEQIHELCTVGGELATARDASQAIIYVRNSGEDYALVHRMLQYLTLKHMDGAVPFKQEHLRRFKPPAVAIDVAGMARYFDTHNDRALVNKIGTEMYAHGIRIFERIEAERR